VRVHSFTLLFTLGLPLLAHNLATPCLGREPKAKVAIVGERGGWANMEKKLHGDGA